MLFRQRQVLLSERRTPPFAAGRPRLDTTSPAALHRYLRTGPLCMQRTRRGSLDAGLVCLNSSHLPQASPCQSRPCTGVRALRGRSDIARLVSRSTRTRARTRAPPSVANGLIHLVVACNHTRACAGMSKQTSAQLRSTCALDQTPAASACGVRGLQGHDIPTVLKYWECATRMAGVMGIVSIICMLRPYRRASSACYGRTSPLVVH